MASYLIAYGTGEGQTATVARYIEGVLDRRGHDATTVELTAGPATVDVAAFDAVLIGASVNSGGHQRAVVDFARSNRAALDARPSAFFDLSWVAGLSTTWAENAARRYAESLIEETDWHPDRLCFVGGAVKYTEYDRFTRLGFKLVSALTTGDTDTSRDYEYTDSDHVERFATEFAQHSERRFAAESRAEPHLSS